MAVVNLKVIKSLLLLFFLTSCLEAHPLPLLSVGGGYYDAGKVHSGGLIQAEYKFGKYYLSHIRPQACLIIPEFRAFFLGAGVGIELYAHRKIVFCPNFCPGLYFKGKGGRDLGFPLEFRSAFEVAYEFENGGRIGGQFYHISNASLSSRNPGSNALTLYIALPLML